MANRGPWTLESSARDGTRTAWSDWPATGLVRRALLPGGSALVGRFQDRARRCALGPATELLGQRERLLYQRRGSPEPLLVVSAAGQGSVLAVPRLLDVGRSQRRVCAHAAGLSLLHAGLPDAALPRVVAGAHYQP